MYERRSRLSKAKRDRLVEHFVAGRRHGRQLTCRDSSEHGRFEHGFAR